MPFAKENIQVGVTKTHVQHFEEQIGLFIHFVFQKFFCKKNAKQHCHSLSQDHSKSQSANEFPQSLCPYFKKRPKDLDKNEILFVYE